MGKFSGPRPDAVKAELERERRLVDDWRCPKCGSPRWVSASLTGPVLLGGKAIRQCVPCGHYSDDPVPERVK